MSSAAKPWEDERYGEIVGVKASHGVIDIDFGNGDMVEIPISDLGLESNTDFRVDQESGALIAVTGAGDREIDWMVIRASADPAFAAEIRKRDAEEARRIGTRLRVLRENKDLAQNVVAQRASMSAPQLAKIESGESDLRISTVWSVLRGLDASFADISGPDAPEVSVKVLSKQARDSGAPAEVVNQIATKTPPARLAAMLAHAFAWRPESLLEGPPKPLPRQFAMSFKARDPEKARTSPLARLAQTVAEASAKACEIAVTPLSSNPAEIREGVVALGGEVSLMNLTKWAWNMGIVVVPMSGAPSFSAAAWEVEERPVVVLNSSPKYVVYWLFDLAHEISHLALGHPGSNGVIDVDKPGMGPDDEQEQEANDFALDLLVPDSKALIAEIRKRCEGSLEWQKKKFKWKAIEVAKEAGVPETLMLTVASYALTDVAEPVDRWGSTNNEAEKEGPARPDLQKEFADHIDLGALPEMDCALIEAVVLE